jgi:hypothetical protein
MTFSEDGNSLVKAAPIPRQRLVFLIMISRYRITVPIRAVLDSGVGQKASIMLPAGAVLYETSQHSTTLSGMVAVVWGGRHYFVYPKDLSTRAERVSTA